MSIEKGQEAGRILRNLAREEFNETYSDYVCGEADEEELIIREEALDLVSRMTM
jgi:hypothetical protein